MWVTWCYCDCLVGLLIASFVDWLVDWIVGHVFVLQSWCATIITIVWTEENVSKIFRIIHTLVSVRQTIPAVTVSKVRCHFVTTWFQFSLYVYTVGQKRRLLIGWLNYWSRLCIAELMCYNNSNCLNGGTCHEDFPNHSYTCECPPSTNGSHCEHGEVSLCHYLIPVQFICVHGGPKTPPCFIP